MRCYVFSIGEKTTDLCCELMREYGFEVILYQDKTTLWEKLKRFYNEALKTDDTGFMRIDADIIPYRRVIYFPIRMYAEKKWICANGMDWYKQDEGAISIHYMPKEIVKDCLDNIDSAEGMNRPESHLWRLPSINSRTLIDDKFIYGLHGYGQKDQRSRIKSLKESRNQEYNWSLVDRIEAL